MALLPLALTLGGCMSPQTEPIPDVKSAMAPTDPIADLIALLPPERIAAEPEGDVFVGKSVDRLEARIGAPALVRREGANEFRRYDLGPCRAYAIVIPSGGNVVSLSTGPAARGQVSPSFQTCLAVAGLEAGV